METKLRLLPALRQYWTHLIGLAIYPTVWLIVFSLLPRNPIGLLVALGIFSGLGVLSAIVAVWPLYRDAPLSFWLVACIVHMVFGGGLAIAAILGLWLVGLV